MTFSDPFWQQENLSGTFFSNTGSITELYDHCNHEKSKYALCGFINSTFKHLAYADRRSYVINQLKNVFGDKIEELIGYDECVWSDKKYTFEASAVFLNPHQNNGNPIFRKSYCDDKLLISSSEAALVFPGYMEGAVNSANITVEKMLRNKMPKC